MARTALMVRGLLKMETRSAPSLASRWRPMACTGSCSQYSRTVHPVATRKKSAMLKNMTCLALLSAV